MPSMCYVSLLLSALAVSCHCESIITFGTEGNRAMEAADAGNSATLVFISRALPVDAVTKFGNVYKGRSDGGLFPNLKRYADLYNATVEEVSEGTVAQIESDPAAAHVRTLAELDAAFGSATKRLVLSGDSVLSETDESSRIAALETLLERVVSELETRSGRFLVQLASGSHADSASVPQPQLLRRKRQAESEYSLINLNNCLLFFASSIQINLVSPDDSDTVVNFTMFPATQKAEDDSFAYCEQPDTQVTTESPATVETESTTTTSETAESEAANTATTQNAQQTTESASIDERKRFIDELIRWLPAYKTLKEILDQEDGEKQFAYVHLLFSKQKLPEPFNNKDAHMNILFGRSLVPAVDGFAVPVGSAWYTVLLVNATFGYSALGPDAVYENITFRLPDDSAFRMEAPFGDSFHCTSLQLFDTDAHSSEVQTYPRGQLTFENFQLEAFGSSGIQNNQFTDRVVDCDTFFSPPILEGVIVLFFLLFGVAFGVMMLDGIGERTSYPPFDRSSAVDRERFRFVVNVPSDELQ